MKTFALPVVALALVLGLATILTNSQPASAQTDPAPDINQSFVGCYRSILQTDDLFCLTRYELPIQETAAPVAPEAWCKYLVDDDGCIADPVSPTNPTSLQSGAAFITIYDDAVLLGQAQAQRIGHTVGGVYFPAGHGITWGDTGVTGCVESSVTLFTTTTSDCFAVFWNTAANTETAQRAQLSADLISQMTDIETADALISPGDYVSKGLITVTGRPLALEALNVLDLILPSTFQSQAISDVSDAFTPSSGPLALQQEISATATAVAGGFEGIGSSFGVPAGAVGFVFALVGAIGVFVVTYRLSEQNTALSVAAFLTVMLAGVTITAIQVSAVAVAAVAIFAVAAAFVIRKLGIV